MKGRMLETISEALLALLSADNGCDSNLAPSVDETSRRSSPHRPQTVPPTVPSSPSRPSTPCLAPPVGRRVGDKGGRRTTQSFEEARSSEE